VGTFFELIATNMENNEGYVPTAYLKGRAHFGYLINLVYSLVFIDSLKKLAASKNTITFKMNEGNEFSVIQGCKNNSTTSI